MKFSIAATLLPFVATYIVGLVAAAPVNGYESSSMVLFARDYEALATELLRRADLGIEDDLDARAFKAIASAAAKLKAKAKRTKKQPTASQVAEKERKKQFKEGHKQYVATAKKIAAEAKKEAKENHTPYNVNVNYHGPGYAQHGAKATKLAQKGWHDTKNLQQFKQADVSVHDLPSGRKRANTRYHNREAIGGAHVQYMFD